MEIGYPVNVNTGGVSPGAGEGGDIEVVVAICKFADLWRITELSLVSW